MSVRKPDVILPWNPIKKDYLHAIDELAYAIDADTLHWADKHDVSCLLSNDTFLEYVSKSDAGVWLKVFHHLDYQSVKNYTAIIDMALEFGVTAVEPPNDAYAFNYVADMCLAITNTDRWKKEMTTYIQDCIGCRQDQRFEMLNFAYVASVSMNKLVALPTRVSNDTKALIDYCK